MVILLLFFDFQLSRLPLQATQTDSSTSPILYMKAPKMSIQFERFLLVLLSKKTAISLFVPYNQATKPHPPKQQSLPRCMAANAPLPHCYGGRRRAAGRQSRAGAGCTGITAHENGSPPDGREPLLCSFPDYTAPWASIASATFRKPAMFAPAIRSPSVAYSLAAFQQAS